MPDQYGISPTGGFASGLAEGFFNRQNEYRLRQQALDDQQRGNILNILTGILPDLEPGSRGAMLGHIMDFMKVRGKDRGILSHIMGTNLDANSQAYAQAGQDIMSNIVGPDQKNLLPHASPQMLAPVGGMPVMNVGMTPDQTNGKMILRNPIQEHLDALKAQYGAQFTHREALLQEKEMLDWQRQQGLQESGSYWKQQQIRLQAQERAQRKLDEYAGWLSGGAIPTAQQMAIAANALLKSHSLDDDAKTELANLRRAQVGALQTGGKPMTEAQQRGFDENQQKEIQRVYGDVDMNRRATIKQGQDYRTANKQLVDIAKAKGFDYDTSTGEFTTTDPKRKQEAVNFKNLVDAEHPGLRQKEQKLKQMEAESEIKMRSAHDRLSTFFDDYIQYEPGHEKDPWYVQLKKDQGGVQRSGAPRTGTNVSPVQKKEPPSLKMDLKTGKTTDESQPQGQPQGQLRGPTQPGMTWYGHYANRELLPGERITEPDGHTYRVVEINGKDGTGRTLYKFQQVD